MANSTQHKASAICILSKGGHTSWKGSRQLCPPSAVAQEGFAPSLLVVYFESGFKSSPDWLQTCCVTKDDFELMDPSASTSLVLGVQACFSTPNIC